MSLSWIFFLMVLAWARPLFAAEGHVASINQLFFPLINFLIFLYLLKRFLVPVIQDYLRSRRERLMSALEEAQGKKKSAEAALLNYRERLGKSAEEARALSETFRTDGERQKAKIISDAEEMARKITLDAQFQAEQEVKVARQRLRRELAGAARAEAEKLIRRHLEPGDQERLVEEFLSQLEGIR
jgi:F-type H+-transporting ATPase subunit b